MVDDKRVNTRVPAPETLQNTILKEMPAADRSAMLKLVEFVELPRGTLLNEPGRPIEKGYFIHSGLASLLNVMNDGRSIEVGLVGYEGFVGLPLLAGFKTSATEVVMQVGGSGYAITAKDFAAALEKFPSLGHGLSRFGQQLTFQAMQVAACNRLHSVQQSLAKWLLMSHDRLSGDLIPLTQEFLAHMLGTRRASVTVAAGHLQKKGLIAYKRGEVTVKNRRGLEEASCECYARLIAQVAEWNK
jgi:CRP-like cAMP-binding protein